MSFECNRTVRSRLQRAAGGVTALQTLLTESKNKTALMLKKFSK